MTYHPRKFGKMSVVVDELHRRRPSRFRRWARRRFDRQRHDFLALLADSGAYQRPVVHIGSIDIVLPAAV